jgi:hypothetical protein
MTYDRRLLLDVLIYHQRASDTGCACGWSVLGASHAEHIADVYEESMTVLTSPAKGNELGAAICAAWGLDPSDVRAIDLHWRPQKRPWADVEMFTTEGVVREVLTLAPMTPPAESDDE